MDNPVDAAIEQRKHHLTGWEKRRERRAMGRKILSTADPDYVDC